MRIRGRVWRSGLFAAALAVAVACPITVRANATSGATFDARFAANVPADVRGAVGFAMTIWSQRIDSPVPIAVDVSWGGGLPRNVASSTEPVSYEPVGDGSLQPVALANALAGRDLAPETSDIRLLLGSSMRWYTGSEGAGRADATDMVTMVLHELAHGLGFAASFRPANGGLAWGPAGAPVGLDAHLYDGATGFLVDEPTGGELLASATSRRVVWGSNPEARCATLTTTRTRGATPTR